MPSTYTTNNGIEKIATGEQSGTWGDTTNTNFDLLDTSLDGQISVALGSTGSTGSPNTLPVTDGSTSNGRNRFVEFTGTPGGDTYVQLTPADSEKVIHIQNSTNQTLFLFQGTYDAGRDYQLPAGRNAVIRFTGAGASASYAYNALEDLEAGSFNSGVLQAKHDGTNAIISNEAGDLKLQNNEADKDILIQTDDGSGGRATYIMADGSTGATKLSFATGGSSAVKLATTNTGVDITGGFTATDGSTITVNDNSDTLSLVSTDTDASQGPILRLFRDVVGAASDVIGTIHYRAQDVAGNEVQYAEIEGRIGDATDGAEDGQLILSTMLAGTNRTRLNFNSTEAVFNEASLDLDFRVESDNDANAFFVNGADGNCGIGTNSPATALSVVGTGTFTKTNNDANIILETTDTDASAGPLLDFYRNPGQAGADSDLIGRMEFNGLNDASEKTQFATIFGEITDASDGTEDGSLKIQTMLAGTTRDRITMNATETVFNDDSRDLDFRVESDADTHAFFVEGSTSNIGMSVSDPDSHTPQTHNPDKRSFVNYFSGGTQFVAGRSDTTVVAGDYVGGYLFKTNDNSVNKFGGMIATADDSTGNAGLEFYPVSNAYENSSEGSMQLDDTGDIYLRAGGIRVGRSHGNVYTATEESVIIYHQGSGSNDTYTAISARDGTGADYVFRHQRQGTIKSEIEENGDFLSATNSYGSTSDERLKENIVAASSQWNDIKALQFKNYSMIEDKLDAPNMLGVMAQDLQASGMNGLVKQVFQTDAEDNPVLDADGNQKEFLSVKYSVLYMKAIKALQEAMAKIEVLETKVAALEAG
jgi:hypothetical protein